MLKHLLAAGRKLAESPPAIMAPSFSRRRFLGTSTLATAPALLGWTPARAEARRVSANDKIQVAGIGVGSRGRYVLQGFLEQPDVRVIEVCDVQETRRSYARGIVNGHYGERTCRVSRDLRETLARDDVDAVLIATGDNWHAVASIMAAKAGKDIYCEKPCGVTLGEARELATAVTTHGRIFQAGTQRRNLPNFQHAVNLARDGRLGKLLALHASIGPLHERHDWMPGQPEPDRESVDWDLWLGPAPWRPFHPSYVNGAWRPFADFNAGANVLDWGAHTVDLCQWAADADETGPVEFEPGENSILARYAGGLRLILRHEAYEGSKDWLGHGTCPVRFEGEEGWVETGDKGTMSGEGKGYTPLDGPTVAGTVPGPHVREFLDCVRSRARPACHEDIMRRSHAAAHAAAIAWRLGRKVVYDPITESFPGDEAANRLATRAHRFPFQA